MGVISGIRGTQNFSQFTHARPTLLDFPDRMRWGMLSVVWSKPDALRALLVGNQKALVCGWLLNWRSTLWEMRWDRCEWTLLVLCELISINYPGVYKKSFKLWCSEFSGQILGLKELLKPSYAMQICRLGCNVFVIYMTHDWSRVCFQVRNSIPVVHHFVLSVWDTQTS